MVALFCFSSGLVSDDHERTQKSDFFVLDRKYLFGANLVRKIKIVSLNWNLEPRGQFKYEEFSGDVHFFFFSTGNTVFG